MTPGTTKGTNVGPQAKYPMFISGFKQIWIFLDRFFFFKSQIPNFMTIRLVGAALLYVTGGRTDGHDTTNMCF